jgi:hypothetical protein
MQRLHGPSDAGHTGAWEDFRNDHELLERLKVTPDELEALEKCFLFGTLASKQDLLFILRQIREATGTSTDEIKPGDDSVIVPAQLRVDADAPKRRRETVSATAEYDKALFKETARIVRYKSTETILLLASAIVSVAGLVWALLAGLNALSERVFSTAAIDMVDTSALPGLGSFGFDGGVRVLVEAEVVFVAMFVLVYGYDRWKAMRRLRSYRRNYSGASRL